MEFEATIAQTMRSWRDGTDEKRKKKDAPLVSISASAIVGLPNNRGIPIGLLVRLAQAGVEDVVSTLCALWKPAGTRLAGAANLATSTEPTAPWAALVLISRSLGLGRG